MIAFYCSFVYLLVFCMVFVCVQRVCPLEWLGHQLLMSFRALLQEYWCVCCCWHGMAFMPFLQFLIPFGNGFSPLCARALRVVVIFLAFTYFSGALM